LGELSDRNRVWIVISALAGVSDDLAESGVATSMNSLIRPALYGAWHVVGPICETGDVLGRDRLLPDTQPGDVLLIENAGAYGAVMASRYNLREPAAEIVLDR
jgi:diaminopimelate decarboxylase/aspartate kinase